MTNEHQPQFEPLEERILLSASPIENETAIHASISVNEDKNTPAITITDLLVIDTSVDNYEDLIAELDKPGLEIQFINSNEDGVEQLSHILKNYSNLNSLHILSHGSAGQLSLGNSQLNSENLAEYEDAISQWSSSFAEGADILIYGCDLAGNVQGQNLVERLSELTGTDIAASDDITGFGGDVTLEHVVGSVEADVLVDQAAFDVAGVSLAPAITDTGSAPNITRTLTFTAADPANDFDDFLDAVNDANVSAIELVNNTGADLMIDFASTLTINRDLTITASGVNDTLFDGGDARRLFQVTAGDVTFENLTFQNANSGGADGGAIFVTGTTSALTVRNSDFISNNGRFGGSIYNSGTGATLVENSSFTDNTGVEGAAIYIINAGTGSTATVTSSVFTNNNTSNHGGAIVVAQDSTLIIQGSSTFTNNRSNLGGAIRAFDNAHIEVTGAAFNNNSATGQGGAIFGSTTGTTSSTMVTNSSFTGNTANNGGAIAESGASLVISGSTFTSNIASTDGGAITARQTVDVDIDTSTFTSNAATNRDGGAIKAFDTANVNIQTSTFDQNSASRLGGALNTLAAGVVIDIFTSTFSNNVTTAFANNDFTGSGSAIAVENISTAIDITNSTFTGNDAGNRGTIWLSNGADADLQNVTISGNTAGSASTAIYARNAASTLTIQNTILDGDAFQGTGSATLSSVVDNGFNFYTDDALVSLMTTSGAANLVTTEDLDLQPLADNGGPTQTLALGASSVAIEAGTGLAGDQRGLAVFGTQDVGAFELQTVLLDIEDEAAVYNSSTEILVSENGALSANIGAQATLTFQITSGNNADDTLFFNNGGGPTAGINVAGSNLRDGNSTIGTVSSRSVSNGAVLSVTFNSGATHEQVVRTIRAIQYDNSSGVTGTDTKTVTITATNLSGTLTATDTRTINHDSRPVITPSVTASAFSLAGGLITIDAGITVTDPEPFNLTAGITSTVTVISTSTGTFVTGDELAAVNNTGYTASYNSSTGVLTITATGTDSNVANYQAILRTITFDQSGSDRSDRTITYNATDGNVNANPATVQAGFDLDLDGVADIIDIDDDNDGIVDSRDDNFIVEDFNSPPTTPSSNFDNFATIYPTGASALSNSNGTVGYVHEDSFNTLPALNALPPAEGSGYGVFHSVGQFAQEVIAVDLTSRELSNGVDYTISLLSYQINATSPAPTIFKIQGLFKYLVFKKELILL